MEKLLRLLLLGSSLLLLPCAQAQTEDTILLGEDLEIPITRYAAFEDEAPILLWLPSSRGVSDRQAITASALGDLDIETWIVDLHTAYFIDTGSESVQHFLAHDIRDLIAAATAKTPAKVYLLATGSAAKPALEGIALYQQEIEPAAEAPRLGGALLFHPALTYPALKPGEAVDYLPIARNSTVPIYFIQPSISTRQSRSDKTQEVLQSGGSPVFFHPMPGISAGFHLRPDHSMSEADLAQRAQLPQDLKRAINLLSVQAAAGIPPELELDTREIIEPGQRYGLKSLKNRPALHLELSDLQGHPRPLDYGEKKITLVSFWTSWCPPCIKELPSLRRLYEAFEDQGLQVVTVNVSESADVLQPILEKYAMHDYLNLSDPDGEVMNAWNVYAFPSNFLVSQSGFLTHGSIGGVEWDDADVREVVTSLLNQD